MQLNAPNRPRLTAALGLMTATLFAAGGVHAQVTGKAAIDNGLNDDTTSDLGMTRIDTAVLFYQEAGGRVRATEPVASITMTDADGDSLHVKLTADTLTGATPNGAAPWSSPQNFLTPAHAQGTKTTVTSASGNSTLVTVPGTDVTARQYTTPANTLPLDSGFQDQRYAVDVGYTGVMGGGDRLSFGGAFSSERDYRSLSGNIGYARDFNDKNTTLSAALNLESDLSKPFFGTPEPLTQMSGNTKRGNQNKTVVDAVFGLSQVMNRSWLAQVNYSVGNASGYQTDPYRIISVVNGTTGAPTKYLYESRPSSRIRQSLFVGNKIALWGTVADVSGRLYHDSWGINAQSIELADRIPVLTNLYVEPHVRYYHQSAAKFYRDYLIDGAALPDFASSDSRLAAFNATTVGIKIGMRLRHNDELYVRADSYTQTGTASSAGAPGYLAQKDLFSGTNATNVILGYTFGFY